MLHKLQAMALPGLNACLTIHVRCMSLLITALGFTVVTNLYNMSLQSMSPKHVQHIWGGGGGNPPAYTHHRLAVCSPMGLTTCHAGRCCPCCRPVCRMLLRNESIGVQDCCTSAPFIPLLTQPLWAESPFAAQLHFNLCP